MKKALSLLLALVICLSLCACGKDATITNPYEKYSALFDMLEAGKYEDAHGYIDDLADTTEPTATEPTEIESPTTEPSTEPPTTTPTETEPPATEPEYTAIELTLENWDTYYEIMDTGIEYRTDAFGEISNIWICQNWELKKEYRERLSHVEDFAVEFTPKMAINDVRATVDLENKTYELITDMSNFNPGSYYAPTYIESNYLCPFSHKSHYSLTENSFHHYIFEVDVSRIKGTLYLLND